MLTLWQIPVLFVLLFFSSFFSAAETSLMSLGRIRVRQLTDEGHKGAEQIRKLVSNPSTMLGAILIGNNVANIAGSALATSLFIGQFGAAGVGIATVVMTILVLLFGEIAPKSIAAQNSERVALKVAPLISVLVVILAPITAVLSAVTNIFISLVGGKVDRKRPFVTEEELRTIVTVGHEEGVLAGEEKQMIDNVFQFGDFRVKDIMTPRIEMVVLDVQSDYNSVLKVFREEQFSRIPVYEDSPDNIVGVLYLKDLLYTTASDRAGFIKEIMRPPFFTFEFKRTADLFQEMRSSRVPLAVVLDEYGDTAGILTMEDMVEEIVGEIEDEYDQPYGAIEKVHEHEFIVDGSTHLRELNEALELGIESGEFDSLGGFVVGQLGRIPKVGEATHYQDVTYTVEEMKHNRIRKIRVKK